MTTKSFFKKHTASLAGKTVAITGATGGLGRALCRHLAALGASLLLLDRNSQKSNALIDALKAEFPALFATHVCVDMADFASVAAVTERLKSAPPDVLILNAGAYHIPRKTCDTGLDNVFQINFASPYYMARTLHPLMRERGGRIVAVGSIAHNYEKSDQADVDFSTRKKPSHVYGNAKRYLMAALWGTCCAQGGVAVTHPGITFTGITAHYPKVIFALIKHPMKLIFMPPRRASLCILRGVFEDTAAGEWIGPRVLSIWGAPAKKRLSSISNEEQARICATAERIYQDLQAKGENT